MDPYEETHNTWNKVAALYEEKFMDLPIYNASYDAFCNALNNVNASILEIGCGPGNITKYLLSKQPNFSVTGIDAAPNMIALAEKNNPSAIFRLMDCRDIQQLNTKYDGIICGFCIPYLSEAAVAKLISDCGLLLQPQGILYLSFVAGAKTNSGFQTGVNGRVYFNYYTVENITELLLVNGFERPTLFNVNYKKSEGDFELHTIMLSNKF